MEYLRIKQVQKAINTDGKTGLDQLVRRYNSQFGLYSQAIKSLVARSNPLLKEATDAINEGSRTNPINPISRLSAPYFVNEDVLGGVLVGKAVQNVNEEYSRLGLPTTVGKVKLGPGVGYIQAPDFYGNLLRAGMQNPELAVNYNAPNGEKMTRAGMSLLMNAKTENQKAYGEYDVFLTSGATEAIDATVATFSKLNPDKSVFILGPSYYAGSFSAQYRGIPVKQIVKENESSPLFPSVGEVRRKIPENAGLIIFTGPNNPTGEIYSENEINELIGFAKARGILVLFDDIFGKLSYKNQKNPVQIAQEMGALDNLVVVDSLSKSLNIPGIRPGVIATTNAAIKNALSDYFIAVKCNPPLTYGPLFMFEGMAREMEKRIKLDPKSKPSEVYDSILNGDKAAFSKEWFLKAFSEWNDWNKTTMSYYRQNLSLAVQFLQKTGVLKQGSPDQGAFNTLVQLTSPKKGTNTLDFLYKLMIGTATYTQAGPCFGLDQSQWDNLLGVWTRITYASDRKSLEEGLVRLAALAQTYDEKDMGNSTKYPTLSVTY